MSYAASASALTSSVGEMRNRWGTRLRAIFLFQGRDQRAPAASTNREHYFGALRSDLGDKGAYTPAVRALMAS
jgi:hypothetical protein